MAVSIQDLRNNLPSPSLIANAINEVQAFELLQRKAKMYASATMVPDRFAGNLGNCAIAVQMADQMKMPIITVMQSLYVVHGNPAWSAAFLIGCVNTSGRFEALRFEWKGKEGTADYGCRAWTIEKSTGERLDGTWIDWKMVTAEGWDKKNASKWKTMAEQMFRYRAGAFWQRAYAPEISLGLRTVEEERDTYEAVRSSAGHYEVKIEDLQPEVIPAPTPAPTPEPIQAEQPTESPEFTEVSEPEINPAAETAAELIRDLESCDTKEEVAAIGKRDEYQTLKRDHPDEFKSVSKAAKAALDRVAV